MATAATVPPVTIASAAPLAQGSAQQSQPQQTVPQSALYAMGGRLREYASGTFAQRKPWAEVLDKTSFGKPASLQEATSRLRKNAVYFKINYLILTLTTVAIAFVTHPGSLFVLAALMASWMYVYVLRTGALTISGRTLSERETFLGMSVLSFVVVFFLTSVGNLVFTALMMSSAVVALHGACRVPDDLFLDESESQQGLLAIFSAATYAGTTGANAV